MLFNIPKPCNEDWGKMSPNEKGRFCNVCSKTVVDFTKMTDEESLNYFEANKGKRICGRIQRASSFKEIEIKVNMAAFSKKLNYIQLFTLAFLFVFGVLLTGFKNHPTIKASFIFQENKLFQAKDTPPPPPLVGLVIEDEDVFGTVEILPTYIGGHEALKKYLNEKTDSLDLRPYNKHFPRNVYIKVVIDTLGKPKEAKIVKGGFDSSFNQKIIKIIEEMPNWNPGRRLDKLIETRMVIPIKFTRKEE